MNTDMNPDQSPVAWCSKSQLQWGYQWIYTGCDLPQRATRCQPLYKQTVRKGV